MTDADLKRLPLEQLEDIQVARTQVTPLGIQELERCRRQRSLSLDADQFTDDVEEFIRSTPSLRALILEGLEITDEDLARVGQIPTLKVFFLRDTSVSPDAVAKLHKARNVQVEIVNGD